jgi:hypothetical protein
MLELKCNRCHRELREPGALIFSPPKNEAWLVEKYHVCAECWPKVAALLKNDAKEESQARSTASEK